MKICDLHCDTSLELYRHGYSLADAPCAVSLAKAAGSSSLLYGKTCSENAKSMKSPFAVPAPNWRIPSGLPNRKTPFC